MDANPPPTSSSPRNSPQRLWQKWLDFAWGGRHPSDLARSERLVRALKLPPDLANRVLAFRDTRNGPKIFVLGSFNLSERSASDVEKLVQAAKPKAVVAEVGSMQLFQAARACSELGPREGVPTSALEVLRRCVTGAASLDEFRTQASDQFLVALFGSSMYRHVTAAEEAAKATTADFKYFTWPPVSLELDPVTSHPNPKEEEDTSWKESIKKALQKRFSPYGSSVSAERFRAFSHATDNALRSLADCALKFTPPPRVSLPNPQTPPSEVDFEDQVTETPGTTQDKPPTFLPPDIQLLLEDLPAVPGVWEWGDRPLKQARALMWNVAGGAPIQADQLADATILRVAVENLRLGYNAVARDASFEPPGKPAPLSDASPDDLRARTLIHTLKQQAAASGDVVALVPAEQIPRLRRLWSVTGPPQVADWSEECIRTPQDLRQGIQAEEHERRAKEKETWLAVAVAGLGTAGGATYAQGGTLAKIASSVPKTFHLFKAGLALLKRNAGVAVAKAAVPQGASVKAGLAAKTLAPKTTAAAVKAAVTTKAQAALAAEKMRAVAHGFVSQVQVTALRAVRVTGYNVMQNSNFRRPGPWLLLGGSAATGLLAYAYSHELETAVAVLPHAASVARLGRGCQSLEQATRELEARKMWPGFYQILTGQSTQ